MNKSIDILIYELRQKLTNDTNDSKLPLSVKAMVVKELYDAVSVASNQQLQKQLELSTHQNPKEGGQE